MQRCFVVASVAASRSCEHSDMKGIVFDRAGRPEDVLALREVPRPRPREQEILIEVSARPIQPADLFFIAGKYRISPVFPQVAGLEGCGTVVETGSGVENIRPGERVAFRSAGAWADFAVAPASRAYRVPDGVPDAVAAQFALNPITAWALLHECNLPARSRVLLTAGRSIVVRVMAVLAQHRHVSTTLLVRERTGGYSVLDGVDDRVLFTAPTVGETLRAVSREAPFDAVVDAVGGPATLDLIESLKPHGRLISYGVLADAAFPIRASTVLYRNMIWQGFGIEGWLAQTSDETLRRAQRELWEVLSERSDLLPVLGSYELADFGAALRLAHEPPGPGKVLLI